MSQTAPLVASPRGPSGQGLRALLGAVVVLLLAAAPALAAMGPTKLETPTVSPTTGTPDTTIVLEVTYRTHNDQAPLYVRVRVGETVYDMVATTPLDYRAGVRFQWAGRLGVGTYTITFLAADSEKFVDELPGGTVTISPPPTPTPPPTPPPTPRPEPSTNPGPGGGSPGSTDPGASDGPATTPTPTGSDGAGSTTGDSSPGGRRANGAGWLPAGLASGSPSDGGSGPTGGTGAGGGSAGGGTTGGDGSPTGGGGSGSGAGGGPGSEPSTTVGGGPDGNGGAASGGWFAALGDLIRGAGADPLTILLPGGGGNTLPTLTAAVGSTAAVGVWMAFSLFGKRRRDELPPASEDVLRSAAASGIALVPSSGLIPEVADPELMMPRWRRPSLLQARKYDPDREGLPERQALAFGTDNVNGHERRLVRYATVRLLDRPDELMGLAVSDLAAGDEVELCERSGLFWFVRTPDGRAGWLHRMTLGEVVVPAGRADDGYGPALAARGAR